MIRTLACLLVAVAIQISVGVSAQTPSAPEGSSAPEDPFAPPDSVADADSQEQTSLVYFGGSVSFDVGSEYTRISLTPQIGFNLLPKLSLGTKVRYEYLSDRRLTISRESHNYGGGIFSRYRFIPQLYGHLEYSYMSYGFSNDRRGVPFLLVGGGYSQPIGKKVSFYAEVLFDLINDEDSPYDTGEGRLNFGIHTGF